MKALYRLALVLTVSTVAVGLGAVRPSTAHAADAPNLEGQWQSNYGNTSFREEAIDQPDDRQRYYKGKVNLTPTGSKYSDIFAYATKQANDKWVITFSYQSYGPDPHGDLEFVRFDYGTGYLVAFDNPDANQYLVGEWFSRMHKGDKGRWELWR